MADDVSTQLNRISVLHFVGLATYMGLFTFGNMMVFSCLRSFAKSWAKKLMQKVLSLGPLTVGFDERCRICQQAARSVKKLDFLQLVVIDRAHHPEHIALGKIPLEQRIELIQAWDGKRIVTGYAALHEIIRRLPLLWPIVLPSYLLKHAGGEFLYRRLAQSRWRQPCQDGKCQLPSQNSFQDRQ
ncbi:MAG: DCC1-like thiol-disulfide oxidoreductase family protein [Oligoflexus sp.]